MLNKRSQSEIDSFFSKLFNIPEEIRHATSSSLTQCRAKLSFTAFKEAMEQMTQLFYNNYSFKRYYGFRLIAIDGSVYTLARTEETIKEFGENVLSNNRKWIKAQVSFAVDVLNNVCTNAVIGPYKESEESQAVTLFEKLGDNNLYLFDRGYFSRAFLKSLAESCNQFCFRLQKNACKEVIEFIKGNQKDCIEYIEVEGKQIKVRLTKVLLDTGEEEYLMTSLFDQKTFSPNKLKALYHMRWGVEEQYKDMKYAICVENFIGKSPNAIKQEFFANILTYNLSMMLCKSAIDRKSNKHKKKRKYQTNKRALLAKIKQCFVSLFFYTSRSSEIIEAIINTVSKESVPIRKNRKYHRNKTSKAKIKPYRAYISVV
jgi:hypothetical protein